MNNKITKKEFDKLDDEFYFLTENLEFCSTKNLRGDYGDWYGELHVNLENLFNNIDYGFGGKVKRAFDYDYHKCFRAQSFDKLCEIVSDAATVADALLDRSRDFFEYLDSDYQDVLNEQSDEIDDMNEEILKLKEENEMLKAIVDGVQSRGKRKL